MPSTARVELNSDQKGIVLFTELSLQRRGRRFASPESDKRFVPGDWSQLCQTGHWHSPVYGDITITPQDLATMYRNFKQAQQGGSADLPLDYDHLGDDPQKPGDGKASGWITDLRLQNDGNELWFLPKWTKQGAQMVADGEYRYVSPFFLLNGESKDTGKNIGPQLRAAAITNRPFLERMKELSVPSIAASDRVWQVLPKRVACGRPVPDPTTRVRPKLQATARATSTATQLSDTSTRSTHMPKPNAAPEHDGAEAPEFGLTCPHCGAPVKHTAADAADAEDIADGGADDASEEMADHEPMGQPEAPSPGSDEEGKDRTGETEEPSSDPGPDETEQSVEMDMMAPPGPSMKDKTKVGMGDRRVSSSTQRQLDDLKAQLAETQRALRERQKGERRQMAEKLLRQALKNGQVTAKSIGTPEKPGWARNMAFRNPTAFREWMREAPKLIEFREVGTPHEEAANNAATTAEVVRQKTEKFMADNPGVVYADALKKVMSATENRSLSDQYEREFIGKRSSTPQKIGATSSVRRL